jgi:hypothetical protein
MLVDIELNSLVFGGSSSRYPATLMLDEIEHWLAQPAA